MKSTSVVACSSLTFAKVVALSLTVVATEPLPVDLVKTVRLKDSGAHNALARSSLDHKIDMTEHDIPFRGQCRRVPTLCDGEGSAIRVVCWCTGRRKVTRSTVCEYNILAAAQGRVGRTLAWISSAHKYTALKNDIPLVGLHVVDVCADTRERIVEVSSINVVRKSEVASMIEVRTVVSMHRQTRLLDKNSVTSIAANFGMNQGYYQFRQEVGITARLISTS